MHIPNTYANHAHNDAVELWLETGIFGIVLIGAFLTWFGFRAAAIWRGPSPPGAEPIDRLLMRAGTLIVALLLVHSLVDYPLRTGAMMAIMAFACALLIEPITQRRGALSASQSAPKHPEPKYPEVPALELAPRHVKSGRKQLLYRKHSSYSCERDAHAERTSAVGSRHRVAKGVVQIFPIGRLRRGT